MLARFTHKPSGVLAPRCTHTHTHTHLYGGKKMPNPSRHPPVHNHGGSGGLFGYFRSHDVVAQRVESSSDDGRLVIKHLPPLADARGWGPQEHSPERLCGSLGHRGFTCGSRGQQHSSPEPSRRPPAPSCCQLRGADILPACEPKAPTTHLRVGALGAEGPSPWC